MSFVCHMFALILYEAKHLCSCITCTWVSVLLYMLVCVSGLIFMANEGEKILSYYIPVYTYVIDGLKYVACYWCVAWC